MKHWGDVLVPYRYG